MPQAPRIEFEDAVGHSCLADPVPAEFLDSLIVRWSNPPSRKGGKLIPVPCRLVIQAFARRKATLAQLDFGDSLGRS